MCLFFFFSVVGLGLVNFFKAPWFYLIFWILFDFAHLHYKNSNASFFVFFFVNKISVPEEIEKSIQANHDREFDLEKMKKDPTLHYLPYFYWILPNLFVGIFGSSSDHWNANTYNIIHCLSLIHNNF